MKIQTIACGLALLVAISCGGKQGGNGLIDYVCSNEADCAEFGSGVHCIEGLCSVGPVGSVDSTTLGDETGDGSADETGDGDGDEPGACGSEWAEKDGTTASIMEVWGAPCTSDADCMQTLGADGICLLDILGVYELPGGLCTKYCDLPDVSSSFVDDATDCDPNGGVSCVGAKDLFSVCMIPCTDSSQCGREGYGCRVMPTLATEGDPTFCLMSTADCCTVADGCGP